MADEHHDPAKEAVEHLQNAALEMVRATRAFLDLAEELLADPGPVLAVAHAIGELAVKGRGAKPPQDHPAVQHIRVS